jgi:hypothetical protein
MNHTEASSSGINAHEAAWKCSFAISKLQPVSSICMTALWPGQLILDVNRPARTFPPARATVQFHWERQGSGDVRQFALVSSPMPTPAHNAIDGATQSTIILSLLPHGQLSNRDHLS